MKIAIPFLALAVAAAAQGPGGPEPAPSLKGVTLKGKAPVSNEVLRFKLPKPYETKLKNGLAVLMVEDHRVPRFVLELNIPVSPFDDPNELPGLAEAAADNMRLGTKARTAKQISDTLAEIGASVNVSTSYGSRYTRVTASGLTDNVDTVLDVLTDVLLNPSFPEDEFKKYKQREISALEQARVQPQFLGTERILQLLYPNDKRSLHSSSRQTLEKMTRDDTVKFYQAHFHPGNAILGVAGDVKPKEFTAKLEKRLAEWTGKSREKLDLAIQPPIPQRKVVLLNRPNSVQSYIVVANRAITRMDPDYISTVVMNRVLGQGPAARLFRNIREEKGYTYGIYSSLNATEYMNYVSTGTSVRTEVTGPALEEILKEFRTIREQKIPADELAGARRAIVASFALRLEDPADVLSQILLLRTYRLPANYWETYPEKVMAVTADEAQRVAQKYIPAENAQIVVVGDAPKLREVLAKFGTVEVVENP